jgi:hypothetical protein
LGYAKGKEEANFHIQSNIGELKLTSENLMLYFEKNRKCLKMLRQVPEERDNLS